MSFFAPFVTGVATGVLITLAAVWIRRREARDIAREMLAQTEAEKIKDLESLAEKLKDSFSALSLNALSKNTEEFLKLANETLKTQTKSGEKELEGKKELIDQTLESISGEMRKIQDSISGFEKDRQHKFGEITAQMKNVADTALKLQDTTNELKTALSGTQTRGQWGERMADDVLRLAGFIEGVNYQRQKTIEDSGARPDYTFLLPQNLKVNMDVKFPLDNYMRYLESQAAGDRENYKLQFLKDVRNRIKEVTSRNYINPRENTLDYVLVFIPNEQIYGFINACDGSILDEALKNRVILCSPLTLYAVLAVIRQAVDNFRLERGAAEILSLMGAFKKQWADFIESMDKMGKKIEEAQKEFAYLVSTRRNKLERPLQQIEELRQQKGIELETQAEAESPQKADDDRRTN